MQNRSVAVHINGKKFGYFFSLPPSSLNNFFAPDGKNDEKGILSPFKNEAPAAPVRRTRQERGLSLS